MTSAARPRFRGSTAVVIGALLVGLPACTGRPAADPAPSTGPGQTAAATTSASTGTAATATSACPADGGTAAVAAPRAVRTIRTGQTGWFSSPALVDLTGDGRLEIVAPFYSTFVFDAAGKRLGAGTASEGRVYAPAVVADLDGDGATDIVVGGNEGTVAAYTFTAKGLVTKRGWPASTTSGGQSPETRGLAAGDLDGDGRIEVVATTTNTAETGSQVFVFGADGALWHPAGAPATSWPRYNTRTGSGGDAGFNGIGNHGYGAYGENVGIGNLDDDPQLEIVVTYDNHAINVFNPDGSSVLASSWYTNHANAYLGKRLGWGQFIRWLDPDVEEGHYHRHSGEWPDVRTTAWLQWTASPPSLADLDGDGHAEVIGVPNVERKEPYETQAYALMVLDGAQDGGARSARRHAGFETLPLTGKPAIRGDGDWYPPTGIPAPTTVDLTGDNRPEIIVPGPDGTVYAYGPTGKRLWSYPYSGGKDRVFASEVVAADLNRDGRPELVFGVYGLTAGSGRLVVLDADGTRVHQVVLAHQEDGGGNGSGIAASPSIGDLDGNGTLEIVATTFDHGIDVFTVPGSGTRCLPWPTGRGGLLRAGTTGSGN